jgi:hypothetical protein
MLRARLFAAALPALLFAACSSKGSSPSGAGAPSSASTTAGTGGAATTTTTSATTGSATAGTGGAGGTGGTGGTSGTGGAGPSDGGYLDAPNDGLGKGGLPPGAMCGSSVLPGGDAGTMCGEGLACCYPCKDMMCDTFCTVACSPQQTGCIGGCLPQI